MKKHKTNTIGNSRKVVYLKIELVIIILICVLSVVAVFMNAMKVKVVFDPIFRDLMADIWKEAGVGSATGLTINITAAELAFGIEDISPSKPIIIPQDLLLQITSFIPILFALLLIPIKKIEKNRTYYVIKNIFCSVGMIGIGVFNLLRISKIGDSLNLLLLERTPELGIRLFTSVNIEFFFSYSFFQLLLIIGGLLLIHLTSNYNNARMIIDK